MSLPVSGRLRGAFALAASAAILWQSLFVAAQTNPQPSAALSEERRAAHVLNRLGFGPRPGDVERVRRLGVEKYVEQQLDPASIDDAALEARLKKFPTLSMSNAELLAKFPNPGQLLRQLQRRGELPAELSEPSGAQQKQGRMNAPQPETNEPAQEDSDNPARAEYRRRVRAYMREQGLEPPQRILQDLQAARVLRATYSGRQLQEVMVDFWTNHFNVYARKGADRWFLTSFDRDVIRPHALGNFRELLEATAKSPAMLFYLDNFQSVAPDARAGRRAEQTPMRQRKRPRRGINENYARELMELHTLGVAGGYTQRDVQEVARAFTGWTLRDPRGRQGSDDAGSFVFNPRLHDDGEKTVLGQKLPAGGGIEDGRRVLDLLVRQPSTARFIATKLARRFVSDNPRPDTVGRAAAAFSKTGGDIKATLRALFTSEEFNSPAARRAKIKTPFELAVSALRALGAETDARPAFQQWLARMGEPLYLYQAPTGYPDTAEHWVSTGALLERLNFALALAGNRIPGTRVSLPAPVGEGTSKDAGRLVDQFLALVLQGDISPRSREVLMKQLSGQQDAARVAALVLGSPEFQRQ